VSIASQYVTGRKVEIRIHPYVYKDANILSAYSVCSSVPFEELTVSMASAYYVSVLVVEVVAALTPVGIFIGVRENPSLVAVLASAYSLSTAVT